MINYIIQVMLFQALFLAVYDFFLQKETFFKWNRIYLLITPFLAFIIPYLRFESIQNNVTREYIVRLPTVFLNPESAFKQTAASSSTLDYISITFYVGIVLFAILFLVRLFKIIQLIVSNNIIQKEYYKLVLLTEKQSAFSFFNYIFINKYLLENKELEIIQHELVHCKQRHSIDLLVFELLKIGMWFNPLVYVYQKRMTLLHEFISDYEVVKNMDKNTYFNKLLSETFNVENISFINQFYKKSLIKKRIVMIAKEKSQKIKQLKYLLVIPLLVAMLVYSSCTNDTDFSIEEIQSNLTEFKDFSNGKYFETKGGKIFIGNSLLVNRYLDVEEFNDFEKKLNTIFNNEESKFDFVVLINYDEERISFFRPKSLRLGSENERDYVESEPVPFAIIEEVPIFPGCEGSKEELRQCLQEKITAHVSENFNSDLAKDLGLKAGVTRIFVMFKIDKDGNITDVMARAPHKVLQEEAIRVVSSLPKMLPGKQKGENVGVQYSLPIALKVE